MFPSLNHFEFRLSHFGSVKDSMEVIGIRLLADHRTSLVQPLVSDLVSAMLLCLSYMPYRGNISHLPNVTLNCKCNVNVTLKYARQRGEFRPRRPLVSRPKFKTRQRFFPLPELMLSGSSSERLT